ncbi:phosphonate C-P lyase system protein PhnH [Aquibacillus albus]|uniref:Alpha-D-ribose 1-methylphosphonate 5-triphosphate synthase subunit PhnH n=1 Tax=Aquibacillus albus TaxID=1168171 RepID=A0ABS2N5E7_9BACI|nr:phosphonate C-P lyase system protein PhnH [Aquibacillus albus]MBM7573304.1 alpha-D-ribose 1-methylphosphonate 5-triphosphate synthase subunit PhnH [Aquibacillus albus]
MIKADYNVFDTTHDTQYIYRKLLDCMARPGKIQSIQSVTRKLNDFPDGLSTLLAIALTLVDREVSYHLISDQSNRVHNYLKWKTFSEQASIENTDYLFINQNLGEDKIYQLMSLVKKGTLEDPHQSATIILHVDELSIDQNKRQAFHLSGPGINGVTTCYVKGLPIAWIKQRQIINSEYPIGVDFILTTTAGEIMAIPRTTVIERKEE